MVVKLVEQETGLEEAISVCNWLFEGTSVSLSMGFRVVRAKFLKTHSKIRVFLAV